MHCRLSQRRLTRKKSFCYVHDKHNKLKTFSTHPLSYYYTFSRERMESFIVFRMQCYSYKSSVLLSKKKKKNAYTEMLIFQNVLNICASVNSNTVTLSDYESKKKSNVFFTVWCSLLIIKRASYTAASLFER